MYAVLEIDCETKRGDEIVTDSEKINLSVCLSRLQTL